MARVFITGSAGGLGRAAAQTLLDHGHEVVIHVRNRDRLTAVRDLVDGGAAAMSGDLSDPDETRGVAAWPPTSSPRTCSPRSSTVRGAWPTSAAACTAEVERASPAWTGAAAARPAPTRTASSSSRRSRPPSPGYGRTCSATPRTLAGCPRRWAAPVRPTICGSAPHPGVARNQRRSRGAHLRRLLVSPAPRAAGPQRRRPAVPGPAARGPGSLHRHASRLTLPITAKERLDRVPLIHRAVALGGLVER
jgi:hypothetical protein